VGYIYAMRGLRTDVQRDDVGVIDGEDAGVGKGPAGRIPVGPWCAWWRLGGQSAVTSAAAMRAALTAPRLRYP